MATSLQVRLMQYEDVRGVFLMAPHVRDEDGWPWELDHLRGVTMRCLCCELEQQLADPFTDTCAPDAHRRGGRRPRVERKLWYTNALIVAPGLLARFFVCPTCRPATDYWQRVYELYAAVAEALGRALDAAGSRR